MSDRALMQLGTARQALAECRTVMEAKSIADAAEAARVYLERTNASVETVNRATEVRLLAERQMGEFLKAMPKAKGVRTVGGGHGAGGAMKEPPAPIPTLAEIGLTKKQSATAQRLAAIPAPEFAERVAVAQADSAHSHAYLVRISSNLRRSRRHATAWCFRQQPSQLTG